MRTAIDTSVLLAIREKEPGYQSWENALNRAAEQGSLRICPVVFAEMSPCCPSSSELLKQLEALTIGYDDISAEAAHLAGCIHWKYRKEGGPRTRLLPDFIIAAHAQIQCDRLAAIDRGYLRRYFPRLKLLKPS